MWGVEKPLIVLVYAGTGTAAMPPLLLLLFCAFYAVVNVKGDKEPDLPIPDNLDSRNKRSACAVKYQIFTKSHTACLPGSSASVVSVEDQAIIVNRHNMHRANAKPTAANMLKMKWDDELAMIAQKWAENCEKKHDEPWNRHVPGRFSLGQNIHWGPRGNWTRAIDLWHGEVKSFNYGDSSMTEKYKTIGHYTQVMWASSSLVGCGQHSCPFGMLSVCNYAPAGNNAHKLPTPYEKGAACAQCPGQCGDSALCDCQGLACRYGGSLNISTCTCSCKGDSSLYTGNDCTLKCTKAQDQKVCTADKKDQGFCVGRAHVCPNLCEVCSYDDTRIGLASKSSATREIVGGAVVFLYLTAVHLLCCQK